MADKITVIACEQDGDEYKVLLSNGTEQRSGVPLEPGDEWVWPEPTPTPPVPLAAELQRALDDNAMLQRALEEANAVIANLTYERNAFRNDLEALRRTRAVAPVPDGLIGVTTSKVDNLPSIEQMPSHPPLFPAKPGEIETPDQRDVREHLERKRALKDKGGQAAGVMDLPLGDGPPVASSPGGPFLC